MIENSNQAQESNNRIEFSTKFNNTKSKIDEDFIKKNIENGTQVKFYFQKLLNFDYTLMLLSSVNIFITILYYDADYSSQNRNSIICLYVMFAFVICSVIITFYRYQTLIKLQISQMVLENYQTIKSSNKIYYMVIEMIILIVQPYPFLNQISIQTIDFYDNFYFNFKFNYILGLFSFAKLFIVFRILLLRTNYMSPRASRNCRMYGCQSNYLFAIKCLFKDTPMLLMGIVFVISVLVFALGFRISQRNLNQQFLIQKGYENPQNLNNFQNALWLTIITMTTVGYGDFYPRTLIGRIIDVILVVWGIFIVSLMVVVLTNALNMDSSQERALIVLNRLEARNIIKQKAANLIGASFRKYMMQKKQKNNEGAGSSKALNEIILKIRKYSKQFKIVNANMRSMYQTDNIYEQMTKQFQFINDQVDFLKQNQNEVNSYLKLYLQNAK